VAGEKQVCKGKESTGKKKNWVSIVSRIFNNNKQIQNATAPV
jgi:hypothetical protein